MALKGEGLTLSCFENGLAMLKRLDARVQTSRASLSEFLEIHEAPQEFYSLASKVVYEKSPTDIRPLPGALELLEELYLEHNLILVSIGDETVQKEKMQHAGISPHFFKEIFICDEKKNIYQKILEKTSFSKDQIVVIGDKISRDLSPAKELGFKTIHIKWGRGLNCIDVKGEVDHTIWNLKECKKILHLISNFQEKYDN